MTRSPTSRATARKVPGPPVLQFSIFLRNRVGALLDVVKLLDAHHIVVLALSIQDSSESAIARTIVSDPDLARRLFQQEDIPFSDCEVLVVELPEGPSDLGRMLSALLMAEVNIIYSYPLLTRPRSRAVLAIHVDDNECASSVLGGEGFVILNQADLSR